MHVVPSELFQKYNPNHDERGRFTTDDGYGDVPLEWDESDRYAKDYEREFLNNPKVVNAVIDRWVKGSFPDVKAQIEGYMSGHGGLEADSDAGILLDLVQRDGEPLPEVYRGGAMLFDHLEELRQAAKEGTPIMVPLSAFTPRITYAKDFINFGIDHLKDSPGHMPEDVVGYKLTLTDAKGLELWTAVHPTGEQDSLGYAAYGGITSDHQGWLEVSAETLVNGWVQITNVSEDLWRHGDHYVEIEAKWLGYDVPKPTKLLLYNENHDELGRFASSDSPYTDDYLEQKVDGDALITEDMITFSSGNKDATLENATELWFAMTEISEKPGDNSVFHLQVAAANLLDKGWIRGEYEPQNRDERYAAQMLAAIVESTTVSTPLYRGMAFDDGPKGEKDRDAFLDVVAGKGTDGIYHMTMSAFSPEQEGAFSFAYNSGNHPTIVQIEGPHVDGIDLTPYYHEYPGLGVNHENVIAGQFKLIEIAEKEDINGTYTLVRLQQLYDNIVGPIVG